MVSINDLADRPPEPMGPDEVFDLGGKRVRNIDTPHVPHGWDAHVLYEETTGTLFCGDLFTHFGDGPALTTGDLLDAAAQAEDVFGATCLTPHTAPTIRASRRARAPHPRAHARLVVQRRRCQGPARARRRVRPPSPRRAIASDRRERTGRLARCRRRHSLFVDCDPATTTPSRWRSRRRGAGCSASRRWRATRRSSTRPATRSRSCNCSGSTSRCTPAPRARCEGPRSSTPPSCTASTGSKGDSCPSCGARSRPTTPWGSSSKPRGAIRERGSFRWARSPTSPTRCSAIPASSSASPGSRSWVAARSATSPRRPSSTSTSTRKRPTSCCAAARRS